MSYKWKNTEVFRNNRFITLPLAACFAYVSVRFSNINNRRVTSSHVAELLSFIQFIEEYLLAIKIF